ncbi:MAG: hypothetical protein ACREMB_20695 [Candidatus Rokuibacteriota bacterium]
MKELAQLLNEMHTCGVIQATLDADVLVAVPFPERLDALSDVYEFCAARGYRPEGEAFRVGAWPAQFVRVFSPLTREAMEQAETADFEGGPFRVVGPSHLAVIARSVGRARDYARILALLESDSVSREEIGRLAGQHGLAEAWGRFEARFFGE